MGYCPCNDILCDCFPIKIKWIKTTYRLPTEKGGFMVAWKDGDVDIACFENDQNKEQPFGCYLNSTDIYKRFMPDYWAPLPEVPKE